MPQRSRTAAAVSSSEGSSVVERTTPDAAELIRVGDPRRRKVAGGSLCLDFDRGVERHQPVRDRDLLHDLDALSRQRVTLQVRHRHPAMYSADAEPVEDIRHQLLKPHVLHPGDAFGAAEISVRAVAAQLALAGVVDEELGDFAERPPLFAIVDDDPDPALLRGLDADLDPVDEIGAASADVRAEHVRPVALVMDTTGDHRPWIRDPLDRTEEVDRHTADRRQQDLDIWPGHELVEHPPDLLEQ